MPATVSIEIPLEVLHAARMAPEELKRELALHLFQQGRLSFGKARELAGMRVGSSSCSWEAAVSPYTMTTLPIVKIFES